MRLVFIHGIHEEHKAPGALRRTWEHALLSAWEAAGLAKPRYALEMPYYGEMLAELVQHLPRPVHGAPFRMPPLLTAVEKGVIRDIGHMLGFDGTHIGDEFAAGVVRSDFAGCEWIQGIVRFLERDMPGFGPFLLHFTRQVDAYLTSRRIRAAVDKVIRPSLLNGPTVIVAHSLGSVIAYRLLRQIETRADVPLLVTLGSPLGICTIKEHLSPPSLAVPSAVKAWLNATDERDCVALHSRLDRDTFADGIENIADVRHLADNPHEIADYLGHPTVAQRIHAALSRGAAVGAKPKPTRRGRGSGCHGRAASPRSAAPRHRTPA
jgi:hypothetical protein